MQRFSRFLIVLTIVPLSWLEPLPCEAQPPAPPRDGEHDPALAACNGGAPAGRYHREDAFPAALNYRLGRRRNPPLELPPPPGGEAVKLELPPLEPGDLRFPINLATALRLADGRPLIVAAAQASAWVAEARLQKAKVLWLPDFNLGFDYIRHDGNGPDTIRGVNIPADQLAGPPGGFGRSQNQNINFFYAGGAAFILRNATDMIFQPLAARQTLNAARWNIQTAKNDSLLMAARAYFNVHRYRGQYAGAIDVVRKGRKLVEEIADLKEDLIPAVEVDRARNFLADLEQQAVSARQFWRRSRPTSRKCCGSIRGQWSSRWSRITCS